MEDIITKYSAQSLRDLFCFDCSHIKENAVQLCGERRICVDCCEERVNLYRLPLSYHSRKECPICKSVLDKDHCNPDHYVRKTVKKLLQSRTLSELQQYIKELPYEEESIDGTATSNKKLQQEDLTSVTACSDEPGTNMDLKMQFVQQQCIDMEQCYSELKQQKLQVTVVNQNTAKRLSDKKEEKQQLLEKLQQDSIASNGGEIGHEE